MALKKVYIGSVGPFLFDDTDDINDPDGDFAGETQEALKSDSTVSVSSGGVSGSFTTTDGKTVTVTNGTITEIV